MSEVSRRRALGFFGAGCVFLIGASACSGAHQNRVTSENALPGSAGWVAKDGIKRANDYAHQIKGYASTVTVNVGECIDFHVSVAGDSDFTIDIYRLGYYQGQRARRVTGSPVLRGVAQPQARLDEPDRGLITCDWSVSWTLEIPVDWTSGMFLAACTSTSGFRHCVPFVVRDAARASDFLVILPFTTYQAYNQYPLDHVMGKSLYFGYGTGAGTGFDAVAGGRITYRTRARAVSFGRPHAGFVPRRMDLDHDSITWMERVGYDVTYATSLDLHYGRVDPGRYKAMVFSGHDEYWTAAMRDTVERGIDRGTSMVFFTANNCYWHVRLEPGVGQNLVMVCYKTDADPNPDTHGATRLWRDLAAGYAKAEQVFIGAQLQSLVSKSWPLMVRHADHWFWEGTGLKNGDSIPMIVGGEADAVIPGMPNVPGVKQVLLSESHYEDEKRQPRTQQTSLYQAASGAWVFCAGTFQWPMGLSRDWYKDDRLSRATQNLFERIRTKS